MLCYADQPPSKLFLSPQKTSNTQFSFTSGRWRDKDSSVQSQAFQSILSVPNIRICSGPLTAADGLATLPSSTATWPRITLITPTLNRLSFLRDLIKNIQDQGYSNLEHIVVDGGSTDGTAEYVAQQGHITFIPGPDRNSHHAMNKGIAAATGEVVGFANTDDRLPPGALANVGAYFAMPQASDVLNGRCFLVPLENPQDSQSPAFELQHMSGERGLFDELMFGAPGFNSWFFRRSLLTRDDLMAGPGQTFDESLIIAADRAWLLRLFLTGHRPHRLMVPTYIYQLHSASATLDPAAQQADGILTEHRRLAIHLLPLARRQPPGHAHALSDWIAHESWQLLRRHLRSGRVAAAIDLLIRSIGQNPAFPLSLLRARRRRRRLAALAAALPESGSNVDSQAAAA
ncbi:glycosyltransferase [Ferrovibrio terrae]|nr:glycosyltransferase [Ferrovibrio terrae]